MSLILQRSQNNVYVLSFPFDPCNYLARQFNVVNGGKVGVGHMLRMDRMRWSEKGWCNYWICYCFLKIPLNSQAATQSFVFLCILQSGRGSNLMITWLLWIKSVPRSWFTSHCPIKPFFLMAWCGHKTSTNRTIAAQLNLSSRLIRHRFTILVLLFMVSS